MGLGSAFAAGSGIVRPQESFIPIINQINQRRRSGGGGGGISMPSDLARRRYEDQKNAKWSAENQERSRNAGKLYTDREWAAREAEKNRGLEREKLDIDRTRTEGELGIKSRRVGISERKDARDAEMQSLAIDQERRAVEHQSMMNQFMTGNTDAVTAWFVKNAPKQKDGSAKVPIIDFDGRDYYVTWPGADEPEPMDRESLGKILQSLSPAYERPKSDMERAKIDKTMAHADQMRSKGSTGITKKDELELRIEDAANRVDLPGYESPFDMYDADRSSTGGRDVVATGTETMPDGSTRRVVKYSDGSIGYPDDDNEKKRTNRAAAGIDRNMGASGGEGP